MSVVARAARRIGRPVVGAVTRSMVGATGAPGTFALTYDDGPEPPGTPAVLEALREAGARATFFVLVLRARAHRSLLAEVVAAGHEIALHGLDHRPVTGFSPGALRRRTAAARAELEDLVGAPVRWFRPPYGHQRARDWGVVRSLGLQPVLWSGTLEDWADVPWEQRVAAAAPARTAGAVLLAHDGYADADVGADDGPRPTYDRGDLTRKVLDHFGEAGLRPATVGEVVATGSPRRVAWLS